MTAGTIVQLPLFSGVKPITYYQAVMDFFAPTFGGQTVAPAKQKFAPGPKVLHQDVKTCRPAWNEGLAGLYRIVDRMTDRIRYGECFEVKSREGRMIRVEKHTLARHGGHFRIIYMGQLHIIHLTRAQQHITREARECLADWLLFMVAGEVTSHDEDREYVERARLAFQSAEWDFIYTQSTNAQHGQTPIILL